MDKPGITSNPLKPDKITTVSYFNNASSKIGSAKNLIDVLQLIKTGDGFKNTITALRNENSKEERLRLKKNSPQ